MFSELEQAAHQPPTHTRLVCATGKTKGASPHFCKSTRAKLVSYRLTVIGYQARSGPRDYGFTRPRDYKTRDNKRQEQRTEETHYERIRAPTRCRDKPCNCG
jgi:hypothetical protein